MNIITKDVRDCLVVTIDGDIDHHFAEDIRNKIDQEFLSKTNKNIIFDFSRVTFMDSSGIGVIIGRYKLAKSRGGRVIIACVSSELRRIYEISGLKKIIPGFATLDEALRAV